VLARQIESGHFEIVPTRHGYTLSLLGLACAAGLACGSDQPVDDEPTGPVTGSPLDTSGEDQDQSTDDGDLESHCDEPGWICGEYGICQCTGHTLDCGCTPVECTKDSQCGADRTCAWVSDPLLPDRACVPGYCSQLLEIAWVGDVGPSFFADERCAEFVSIVETPWTEIAGLDSLRYIHGDLYVRLNPALVQLDGLATVERVASMQIENNPALTSIAGLAGLQEIVDGGEIINNPLLPTGDVEALLAQIPGGDAVTVCGNLDGDPC